MQAKNLIAIMVLLFSIGTMADRTPVASELYYSGAAVGTFTGFGIGQAIQGRYKETGFIFTLSELSCVAVIFSGVIWANIETSRNYAAHKEPHMHIPVGALAMVLAGSIVGGGFRIWDIVDLWVGAVPVETQKTTAFNSYNKNHMSKSISKQGIIFDLIRINF